MSLLLDSLLNVSCHLAFCDLGADIQCAHLTGFLPASSWHGRILHSLREVNRHLAFWEGQLQGGAHGTFMLLGRGPSAFLRVASEHLLLRSASPTKPGLSATDKMQRRVSRSGARLGALAGIPMEEGSRGPSQTSGACR